MIDTAMILAAGKGTRMRPLTDDRPKPLVEVAGRTLIDRILDHLDAAEVSRVIVNVHHMADMLEAHLAARDEGILISDERNALLDTGGGVKRALPLLGDTPFLAVNSDALWVDESRSTLVRMMEAWRSDDMDVLLLMVPVERLHNYTGMGDFHLADANANSSRLTRRTGGAPAAYLYGGVQILKPALFDDIAEDTFSLLRVYDAAAARGRLYGLRMKGDWLHVGDPEAVAHATRFITDRDEP